MKKRILFVTGDLEIGGTQWHLVQLLPQLLSRGIVPTVYTVMQKGRLADRLEEAGIEVIEPPFASTMRKWPQPFRRIGVILLSGCKLYGILWRRPDIVHFFLPMAYLMGGLESLFVPLRWRLMSRRSLNLYHFGHPVLAQFERRLHRAMDIIAGNSRAVIDDLRAEGVSNPKIALIYNGVDLTRFESLPERRTMREELGLRDDTFVMIMVANLLPSKGHADFLDALALIKDRLPADWYVLLAGNDYGCGADLGKQAAERGIAERVRFLGARADVPALYKAADIGILSSHQEGFSNSVIEGMAAGLPMIVTRAGGNPEAIIDQDCGVVVPARKPEVLADAILALAGDADQRRRYGVKARERVEAEFSIAACADRYARLYMSLGDDKRRSMAELADMLEASDSDADPKCAGSSGS
jgi:glycosyltransferase involved in cell wall biosynthesis